MLPVFIVWTQYETTLRGRILKFVPCEHCGTEYVYALEREGMGCGNSPYLLNSEEAQADSKKHAAEALQSYLENDFDPVPCPACGHYQRHMFSKLYDGGSPGIQFARLMAIVFASVDAVGLIYWGFAYIDRPGSHVLLPLAVTLAILAVFVGIIFALGAMERARARRFDPNTAEGKPARIEQGRNRALTRAEFEAKREGGTDPFDLLPRAEPTPAP